MTNKQIANAFHALADLMELHEEDEFRIRSYRNAYIILRKTDAPLADMSEEHLRSIKGVGNAIAAKITELTRTRRMQTLEKYRAMTPDGVVEMLEVDGIGPKKVRAFWKEMGIDSVGELWYACNENRLIEYKGFGLKTQEELKRKLAYFLKSRDALHLSTALEEGLRLRKWIEEKLPGAVTDWAGAVRRACSTVSCVEILVVATEDIRNLLDGSTLVALAEPTWVPETPWPDSVAARFEGELPVMLYPARPENKGAAALQTTGPRLFTEAFAKISPLSLAAPSASELEIFASAGLPFVVPEWRDHPQAIPALADPARTPTLVEAADLKKVYHVHTTWSDGLHSLREMCEYARSLGYTHIGISDHSQSAFYANGLKPDRVLAQLEAIDTLAAEMAPFRILKGIESDILYDGGLDYDDTLLEKFDFVIASVHSNLKMPRDKATARIVRAVEHPATTILGHPTGRLLLSREGYPLDWDAVFEACARCNTAIELNANPHRLDIDYTLIPQALKHGIHISINPDAHSKEGLHDVYYGVMTARKGGVTKAQCFNCL